MINELEGFTKICYIDELKENTGTQFFIDDVEIAVFKVNGEIYALNNVCPHQHSSIIYDGFIEDGFVICPGHGWEFELNSGKRKCGSRGLDSYPVKVVNNEVFIKVIKKELRW